MKRTHGKSGTKEYKAWLAIKRRCLKTTDADYPAYGGAGIRVHPEWVESFQKFHALVGDCPVLDGVNYSLDRINTKGNYEPGNVRWATGWTQANNRTNNRRLEFNGVTRTLSQWAAEYGLTCSQLRKRLMYGWKLEDALTRPLRYSS